MHQLPREVCELALAHVIEDKTEAAYRRGDLLEKRRELMAAWAAFATSAVGRRQRLGLDGNRQGFGVERNDATSLRDDRLSGRLEVSRPAVASRSGPPSGHEVWEDARQLAEEQRLAALAELKSYEAELRAKPADVGTRPL